MDPRALSDDDDRGEARLRVRVEAGRSDDPSERDLDAHVARIAAARRELRATASQVRVGVEDAMDWKGWVRRHPVATTAVVASAGFLVARSVFGLRSSRAPARGRLSGAASALAGGGGAAPETVRTLGRVVGGLLLTTAARSLAPLVVDRGIGWATEYLQSKIEGRRFDPDRASGAETFVPEDDEEY